MIYVLEDDDSIRKRIEYTLKIKEFECVSFAHPEEFWVAIAEKKPSLILLDIMLPDEDGISILKKLRESNETADIPVIMLTAKYTEFDIVTGLDSGADDYITKPFGTQALVSRIKAVLRRYEKAKLNAAGAERTSVELEGIKVDVLRHTVFADERQIYLTVKEFKLLKLLMENRGSVLSREKLLNTIWEINAEIESRTVDVHIRTLRQKIGDKGTNIETIRGVGYKFR